MRERGLPRIEEGQRRSAWQAVEVTQGCPVPYSVTQAMWDLSFLVATFEKGTGEMHFH